MQPLRYPAAFMSIALLALLAALPWGLPPQDRFFLPLLPVVAIHFWCLRHPGLVPEWYVFVVGFLLDVLTHGPLGYWSLIYLLAHVLGTLSAPFAPGGRAQRLGLAAVALLAVTAASWLVASVYFLERADAWPYLVGAGFAGAGAGLVIPLLHLIDPEQSARENARLERGV